MLVTDKIPERLYHGTFLAFMPTIESHGLLPAGGTIDDVPIPSNYSLSLAIEEYRGVYLTNDKSFARSMAEESETAQEEWLEDTIVLEIDTTKLDKDKFIEDPYFKEDEYEFNPVKSWIYLDEIPREAIVGDV